MVGRTPTRPDIRGYGSRHFGRNELVPCQVLSAQSEWRSEIAAMTAADFVAAAMTDRFGELTNWPTIARDYVYPKAIADAWLLRPEHIHGASGSGHEWGRGGVERTRN